MIAGLEVEHFDRVVHFGGNEEMTTFQVDGEVVEVAGDLGYIDGSDQGHRRGFYSCGCLRSHRGYRCEDEKAFYFHVRFFST
jgi:hypothetical protein